MIAEPSTLIGIAILAVAGYGMALVALWRRPRAIKWLAIALVTVALGYLATTDVPKIVTRSTIGVPR